MECDILAGERGPSYNDVSQIKDWKVLHVRFVELHSKEIVNVDNDCESKPVLLSGLSLQAVDSRKDRVSIFVHVFMQITNACLSAMMNMCKFIPPKPSKDLVTLQLEEFSIENKKWLDPLEVRLAVSKEKFANGGFRDAYDCIALSGLKGRFVLKEYQEDKVESIVK